MGKNSKIRRDAKKRKDAERERSVSSASPPRSYGQATRTGGQTYGHPTPEFPPQPGQRSSYDGAIDVNEVVEIGLEEAIAAFRAGDDAEVDATLDVIVTAPPRAGAAGIHPAQVGAGRVLRRAFLSLWRVGWEPLDVAHVGARQLPKELRSLLPVALELDLVAQRSRLSDRFVSQADALGFDLEGPAQLDGQTDRSFVAAWSPGMAWKVHASERLMFVVRFAELVTRLPKLDPLNAPSSSGRRGPAVAIDEKILGRVRALLAKAESTGFEEEADALIAKAQELMSRHSIDVAMLAHERRDTNAAPVAQRFHLDDPYLEAKSLLLHVVATENRCSPVFNPSLGFVTVMGFDTDLAIVDVLFTSLLSQSTVSLRTAGAGESAGRGRTPSFRRSFLLSFAQRIRERLSEGARAARVDAEATFGGALVPVMASRAEAVDGLRSTLFPLTINRETSISNAAGYHAGRIAADQASLGVGGHLTTSR